MPNSQVPGQPAWLGVPRKGGGPQPFRAAFWSWGSPAVPDSGPAASAPRRAVNRRSPEQLHRLFWSEVVPIPAHSRRPDCTPPTGSPSPRPADKARKPGGGSCLPLRALFPTDARLRVPSRFPFRRAAGVNPLSLSHPGRLIQKTQGRTSHLSHLPLRRLGGIRLPQQGTELRQPGPPLQK